MAGLSRDHLGRATLFPTAERLQRRSDHREPLSIQGTLCFWFQWESLSERAARHAAEEDARREARRANPLGKLTVLLRRAKGLKATDTGLLQSGKSDPYVVARLGGRELKSRVVRESVDPVWEQPLVFEVCT
eukprot:3491340-Prymnesium_polylepis.1